MGGIEAPGLQLPQQVLFRLQRPLEDGGVEADALVGMGVAAADARLSQYLGHLKGEQVLAVVVAAVEHLHGVHQLEYGELGGLLRRHVERLPSLTHPVDAVEVVPEGMGGDHVPARLLNHPSQLLGMPDAGYVLVQADYQNMAQFGGHLHAIGHEQGMGLTEALDLQGVPQPVVLCDDDAAQAHTPGLRRQLGGREAAVGGAAGGVQVHVDDAGRHGEALTATGTFHPSISRRGSVSGAPLRQIGREPAEEHEEGYGEEDQGATRPPQ